MTDREIILECALTNQKYMHLRVGNAGFPRVVKLYRRLAEASVFLAEEYYLGKPRPSPHEPAVDAFWWAVQGWSSSFMGDILNRSPAAFTGEMLRQFWRTHYDFADWLRPLGVIPLYPSTPSMQSASGLILGHDDYWTRQVIRLTARWGILRGDLRQLKDGPALIETGLLLRRLTKLPSGDPVAMAYLASDIMFLGDLFGHFNFPPKGKTLLQGFLDQAIDEAEVLERQAEH